MFNGFIASEILQGITLIKMGVAILVVVSLSILAEVVSPRLAGVLSGYPLGAAITLFFFGYEISPQFAAQSAVYTMVGLVATQVFVCGYYGVSRALRHQGKTSGMVCAALTGVAGYFAMAALLRGLHLTLWTAVALPSISIVFFAFLFKKIPNTTISKRVRLNGRVILARSLVAAVFVVIITATAKLVGPRWAGLFSAFPITMLPLVMIIHFTYNVVNVHTILKNVPKGLGSLVVYALAVALGYPRLGIYGGTLVAYALATLYLFALQIGTPVRRPDSENPETAA